MLGLVSKWLIMVIALSGVQFGLKSYVWFQNRTSAQLSSIWNHKYDFRPKLLSTQFSHHFIKSILKSHNFMALNFRFWCNVPSRAGLLKRNRKRFDILFSAMSCDENPFKHNKQTNKQTNKQFWSENENSRFHASKFDSRRLDQWWKTVLSSVVEAETSRCLWGRNWRVQPVQFCDGVLLSCEIP